MTLLFRNTFMYFISEALDLVIQKIGDLFYFNEQVTYWLFWRLHAHCQGIPYGSLTSLY